ncbi:6-phosphogluconate dehydrogenase [Reticulomyxa filosa]|uniref:6-phosphogluconate dehydrogenase n=1 Tax=Reticulomyxa filosa TaxID=46433 RepID=X6N1C7_RETFI|nr:6-phosphogluconate dehydrogenase [Reticulomyxa filosa]|eukprot:ETO19851.1 6-phosphogluconate dehydrogenase [Reticulomyxa filosa]
MAQFFSETIFNCLIYKGYGDRVSGKNHIPWKDAHFALHLGHKDINLVLETANQTNVPMPVANLLHDRFLSAMAQGWHDLDWSAIALNSLQDVGEEKVVQECIDKCRNAKEMKLQ